MANNLIKFFDKLEDKTRARLSRAPLLYALIGGIGIVLFWRGVWHTTDFFYEVIIGQGKFTFYGLADGPLSFLIGTSILLITGVYVSAFIGNRLIISGLNGEKKLTEKTKEEIMTEEDEIREIKTALNRVEKHINHIESKIN